jgi:asparagine synthase (glutamine-hydrolysing)
MCGLTGILTNRGWNEERLGAVTARMTAAIVHRGPDDSGMWMDSASGIALGFRRLSIVDLSPLGHQPMESASSRFVVAFNGEVYNHPALRHELSGLGARFRGHSDTEVILAAFEQWGIAASVRRFVGMFAIAVWDRQRRELSLIRDRLGIKPLFVYHRPGFLAFASELKAIAAGDEFDATIDISALTSYLRYLYVPAPHSIFQHVLKLPPGHILTVPDVATDLPASEAYWSVAGVAAAGVADPFHGTDDEAVAELENLLTDATRLRMQADVPLGALLSGGIDSSTVVALMQAAADRPVKTFTIGFDSKDFNEADHARAIASHLGTDHTELHLTGGDALAVVPRLAEMFDEPLADPSQIPTFLVCQLARREVTVALTGDGGDELFAGYNRYVRGERLIGGFRNWPRSLRKLTAASLTSVSPHRWNRMQDALRPVFPAAGRTRMIGEKVHKFGDLLRADSASDMYTSLLSAWQSPESFVASSGQNGKRDDLFRSNSSLSLLEQMMLADQGAYLPDDLLAKVDRASMAVSLEARVPLLDHRVVEFSWRLPRHLKLRDGRGKWILRQVLYKHVPAALVDREKMGFSVPIAKWLAGPLKDWAGDLLLMSEPGFLDRRIVRGEWDRFLAGTDSNAAGIWALVMFQSWQARWQPAAGMAG